MNTTIQEIPNLSSVKIDDDEKKMIIKYLISENQKLTKRIEEIQRMIDKQLAQKLDLNFDK